MMIDENKINMAKDIITNSSDIETIAAIYYLKRIKEFNERLISNQFNIRELDSFISECFENYLEARDIIQETIDNNIYLYKKDYYLSRLSCIEVGIYTHILILKGKIEEVYDIMYSLE